MWFNSLSIFILAALICWPLTLLSQRIGMRLCIYSAAASSRHIHNRPVPRLGGAAVFVSFLVTIGVAFFAKDLLSVPRTPGQSLLPVVFCGATLIWLLGLLDDVWHMRASYKLIIQVLVAAGVYSLGFQIRFISFPILGILDIGDYSVVFTVLWIVGAINAVNLIDGIDGLCSGVVLCCLLGIFTMATIFGTESGMVVCSALIGSVLMFFVFNFSPASVFLGDSGSYFLGFMVAVLPIFTAAESSSPGVFHIAFIFFLIVPFLDTVLTVVRRFIMGIPMATPDRGHLHHNLLDRKYTHKKITITVSLISIIFVIAGITTAIGGHVQSILAILAAMAASCFLLHLCGITSLKALTVRQESHTTKAVLLKEHAPALFQEIIGAADWTRTQEILDGFSRSTNMCAMSITCRKNDTDDTIWKWQSEATTPSRRQPQLCRTYEVFHDDLCFRFYFRWDSEYSRIQNGTDGLLELISKTIWKPCHEKFRQMEMET